MKILKHLLQISWRNVFRNKRRTILTLLILVIGSTGLILVGGFFSYLIDGFGEYFIHSQTGHLQINMAGYDEKGSAAPFDYLMKDIPLIQREIESNPHVLYTVPRIKFGAMANSEDTSTSVIALGVDPLREQKMGSYRYQNVKQGLYPSTHLTAGQDLDTSDPYGALLGSGLMKTLGLKIGDPINLIVTRQAGAIDGAEFHVRGSFETLLKDFNDRAIKVNLGVAQKLLNVPDEVHSLLVILDNTKNTWEVEKQLMKDFQTKKLHLESISWDKQGSYYQQSKDFLHKIYITVQIIISIIFFFSIANTINMNLFERMREFGTMMAIGNSRETIFSMIFLEATILGLIGAFLGIGIGCIVGQIISTVGIEMPPPPMGSFSYYAVISLDPILLLQVFFIALISTVLAAVIPAYRASHFNIIHALGYV